jgi:hypothetical protein
MTKTCIIKQPAGIGDILFCQGIAKYYADNGYRVIYPLKSNLTYLKDYLAYPNIEFCDVNGSFPFKEHYISDTTLVDNDYILLNLDTSFRYTPNDGIMPSKYQMLNLDYGMWIDKLSLIRNIERERWLYYDYLNLKDGEQYVLLNNKFGTPPDYRVFPIPNIDTSDRLINMDFIEGTTILDWLFVLEKASGIVTVDTCVQYLLEKLNTKYDFYYCFTRDGSKEHIFKFGLQKIFTIQWHYVV